MDGERDAAPLALNWKPQRTISRTFRATDMGAPRRISDSLRTPDPSEQRTFEQGAIRHTGRELDFSILGGGSFHVGAHSTRNGAFVTDRNGLLSDDRGRHVLGTRGPISMNAGTAIGADGVVRSGGRIDSPSGALHRAIVPSRQR